DGHGAHGPSPAAAARRAIARPRTGADAGCIRERAGAYPARRHRANGGAERAPGARALRCRCRAGTRPRQPDRAGTATPRPSGHPAQLPRPLAARRELAAVDQAVRIEHRHARDFVLLHATLAELGNVFAPAVGDLHVHHLAEVSREHDAFGPDRTHHVDIAFVAQVIHRDVHERQLAVRAVLA